jgi:hypothetical protein
MDPVLLLGCAVPPIVLAGLAVAAWAGVASWRRNEADLAALDRQLAAAGLGPTDEPPWRIAEVRGRVCAVKAVKSARTSGGPVRSVSLGVSVVVLVPLDVPLGEHLFRNAGATSPEFDRCFFVPGGGPPVDVPPAVAGGLMRWVTEAPSERVEAGPRSSPALYAGRRLKNAVSVVRVDRTAPPDADAVRRWLGDAVARVEDMERHDQGQYPTTWTVT